MPTYISLVNFTDQGIRNFKDTPKRARAFKELVEQMGGSLVGLYYTMGSYDAVAITEGLDDETAIAAALKVSSLGNVRTTTLRGFDVEEMQRIIQKAD
ncbi:MAG: GYD domain-containing protein [Actinobacteria bacterium]|nr:GYD domain-containing protein [Actinomycetota bacterium]